jgi:hypothetical protein
MRVIQNYDPKDITMDLLYNDDSWGALELNVDLDISELEHYYSAIQEDHNYQYFNFQDFPDRLTIEVSKQYMELGYCGYYCGPIGGYTLAWPKERYEPLPPPSQANVDMFPETLDPEFYEKCNVLPRFRFGYMNTLIDMLGEDSFKQCIITEHGPGATIKTHKDSNAKKLHIPLKTNPEAVFTFGEKRELKFNMRVGKIYILNTSAFHGTENFGETTRAHFITRVDETKIQDIIAL